MMGYSACVGVAGGELRVAEIFEVSPVILVEALEAVVDVGGCVDCAGESEGHLARRSCEWNVGICGACRAGVVVTDVYFLCGGGWKNETQSEADADGTENDVEDDVAARVGDWFPRVDDLLLEFIEEAVIFLCLLSVLGILVPVFVLVLHLNEVIIRWKRVRVSSDCNECSYIT